MNSAKNSAMNSGLKPDFPGLNALARLISFDDHKQSAEGPSTDYPLTSHELAVILATLDQHQADQAILDEGWDGLLRYNDTELADPNLFDAIDVAEELDPVEDDHRRDWHDDIETDDERFSVKPNGSPLSELLALMDSTPEPELDVDDDEDDDSDLADDQGYPGFALAYAGVEYEPLPAHSSTGRVAYRDEVSSWELSLRCKLRGFHRNHGYREKGEYLQRKRRMQKLRRQNRQTKRVLRIL